MKTAIATASTRKRTALRLSESVMRLLIPDDSNGAD
jgi:hypothetical protein